MATTKALEWDTVGERRYETGVSKVAVYPFSSTDAANPYPKGYAWNGVTAINENPTGGEPNPIYADNIKYLSLLSAEDFGASIEAYTYPDEFAECDGSASPVPGMTIGQQNRKMFGLCYRTEIGNDTDGNTHGYKLHLIYGCYAAPSQKNYQTINESPEPGNFSWEVSTTPVPMTGFKPTAHIEIDSTKVTPAKLTALETILYGSTTADAKLPLPDAVKTALSGT